VAVISKSEKAAKTRAIKAAPRSKKLKVLLPRYHARGWRREIFDAAKEEADLKGVKYGRTDHLDLVVRLYLTKSKLERNDVDNRLKDVFDGLQGALAGEKKKRYRKDSIIGNDRHIYRALVEKFLIPKRYANRLDSPGSGGSVTIRPFRKRPYSA
jgi:hypothetical protein